MDTHTHKIGLLAGKICDAIGSVTMESIAFLQKTGDCNRGSAVVLGIGASYGALQALAAVLGRSETGDVSEAVNDDTILYAALLIVSSCGSSRDPENPGCTVTSFNHSPASYLEAATMFERLTGRKVDSILDKCIVEGMDNDSNAGLDMLNQVCANRKPC